MEKITSVLSAVLKPDGCWQEWPTAAFCTFECMHVCTLQWGSMVAEGKPTDVVKVLHLLVLSFCWGMQLWVSFIAGTSHQNILPLLLLPSHNCATMLPRSSDFFFVTLSCSMAVECWCSRTTPTGLCVKEQRKWNKRVKYTFNLI